MVFLFGSLPFAMRSAAYGVLLWAWVSIMNPHRLTWGLAYDMPFAMLIAISTLIGVVFSREPKKLPVTGTTLVLFIFMLWMCVTTVFAFSPEESYPMWLRVMKVIFMVFITMYVLHTKKHIQTLVLIAALSVGFFGIKGGIFTLTGGGENRVWGPEGSFIEENNALALATIMTIPLLRYLQLQATKRWMRLSLIASMILCVFSALGSHSRGALVAGVAMMLFFWMKGKNKLATGLALAVILPVAVAFMPDSWDKRMRTIETYEQDASAMGRINAWKMAANLAQDKLLFGGGFEIYNEKIFARYAPNPLDVHAAHSIYFQVLGEHGFLGLGLFMLFWLLVWRDASWIARNADGRSEMQWAADLARMIQVSLVGYAVGGALLSLAYYDVPYDLAAAVVLTRVLIQRELKGEVEKAGKKASGPRVERPSLAT
jgi:putative inorganic carbon (HCO3(-)) transporter